MDLCPWAEVVYGCDKAWWEHRRGLPEFVGLKICWRGNGLVGFPDIQRIDIEKASKPSVFTYRNDFVFEPVGTVGGGGNSGFQAINLAVQFGARKIILIGFDMTDRGGVHWYGRNRWPMANNPDQSNFRRWIAALEQATPALGERGVRVVNTSRNSALNCFPKMDMEKALLEFA